MALIVVDRVNKYNNISRASSLNSTPLHLPIAQLTLTPTNSFSKEKLEKYLTVEAALLGIKDNISLFFKDGNTNNEISFDPTKSWIPASTIKAYVVLEAYKQKRQGLINFNQVVTIQPQNVVSTELETDEFPQLREGTQVTIRQLVEAMIIQSDNTAYNTLLDILDRRNINNTLRDIGITETVVGEKLNLDDNQFFIDNRVAGRQPNTTTVKDYESFFDLLYQKEIPEANEILSIFSRQKINTMIPALLPPGIIVAHKTGEWSPIYHDGGIVYKPNEPFILTLFTAGNDPNKLAEMARVAFFQSSDVVGKSQDIKNSMKPEETGKKIYLTYFPSNNNVLGVENSGKFPQVTAEDLGIKLSDLSIDTQDVNKISAAQINPKSLLYPIKRILEEVLTIIPKNDDKKVDNYLSLSYARLAELKSVLKSGDLVTSRFILDQSETNLLKAAQIILLHKIAENKLIQLKVANDLQFAILLEESNFIPAAKKEEFIDMVYAFYKKNQEDLKTTVSNSLLANPLKQQPIIGSIKQINGDLVTLQFDNGNERMIRINQFTPIRGFHKKNLDQDSSLLNVGVKIAVLGQISDDGVIIPEFVLRNIPREIPDIHEGVILEIDTKQNVIKILNKYNKYEYIKINSDTLIKGKQTDVSLLGIKAGSYITVFGETEKKGNNPTPDIKNNAQNVDITETKQHVQLSPVPTSDGNKQKQSTETNSTNSESTSPIINATSITVITNDSGKNEKISQIKSTPTTVIPIATPTNASKKKD